MTLDEIRESDKAVLTPADVAEVLQCDPQDIRTTARLAPERLGFPVSIIGHRTKIPRISFLKFMGAGE